MSELGRAMWRQAQRDLEHARKDATDGFFEWADPEGEQFGTERVHDVIHRHRGATATELIAILYRTVLDFARGTPQADDLTAVIVKRTAAET